MFARSYLLKLCVFSLQCLPSLLSCLYTSITAAPFASLLISQAGLQHIEEPSRLQQQQQLQQRRQKH